MFEIIANSFLKAWKLNYLIKLKKLSKANQFRNLKASSVYLTWQSFYLTQPDLSFIQEISKIIYIIKNIYIGLDIFSGRVA